MSELDAIRDDAAIERAAKALDYLRAGDVWNERDEDERELCREDVRAVIAALTGVEPQRSRTVIPNQAVEAAKDAIRRVDWAGGSYDEQARLFARAALEAAAPHLMAAAWDEGYEQADSDAPHSIKSSNPYRKSADAD